MHLIPVPAHGNIRTWFKLACAVLIGLLMLACAHWWNLTISSTDFGETQYQKIKVLRSAQLSLSVEKDESERHFEQVSLPHRLSNQQKGQMHYRVLLPENAELFAPNGWSICVPRWSSSPVVWFKDQKLLDHDNGHLAAQELYRATYLALPPSSANEPNWLDIRLQATPGTFPGLSEIWLGDNKAVNRACSAMQDTYMGARIGGMYLMFFLALMATGIALHQRDGLAKGFAFLGYLWCFHSMVLLDWIPFVEGNTWLALLHLTRPLPGMVTVWLALRLTNQEHRLMKRILCAIGLLGYVSFPLLTPPYWNMWLVVVGGSLIPMAMIAWLKLTWYSARSAYLSDFTFTLAMFFGIGVNFMDIARNRDLLPYASMSLTHLVIPVLAIAIGFLVLERLQEFIRQQSLSARLLEEKLHDQKVKLDASHELMQLQQKKLVLSEERQRLVRDLHDGLGSQLVSASALLKSGSMPAAMNQELSELIDHALLDLRSLLDVFSSTAQSHGNEEDTVTVLLSMLRHRLSPVFRAKGIELDWDGQPLPPHFLTEDHQRLQLLRLLQEACTNIIKHARASKVVLRTLVVGQTVTIEVQDNGQGIHMTETATHPRRGNGLNNMAVRAKKLGAQMNIESTAIGTCVRLVFPGRDVSNESTNINQPLI